MIIFLLTFASSRKVIDKNLQKLRQEYRKFRIDSLITLDASFFEIYNAIGEHLKVLEKPYVNVHELWLKNCKTFLKTNFDEDVSIMFNQICVNTGSLLQGARVMHLKGLEAFFSGSLMKSTAPMNYFDHLCDVIEDKMEDVWKVYSENPVCAETKMKELMPSFSPFVSVILNFTKITIESIPKQLEKSKIMHKIAFKYVENFTASLKHCLSEENINSCVRNLVSLNLKLKKVYKLMHCFTF